MIHVPFMTLPVPLSDELSRSCSPKNWWGSLREIKKKKKHQTIQLTPIAIKLILRISASGEIRRDNQLSVLEKKKKKKLHWNNWINQVLCTERNQGNKLEVRN